MQGCITTEQNSTASANTTSSKMASTTEKKLAIEKYQLPNGLEVVLHQDKSDPIVAVAIQYHVGSNREKPGRTGFAHFFEHMLFQNSKHVGPGNFIKNIGDLGGTLNGGTWQDGTIYYEVVPSDGLEKVLWMESDRMGYFINTVTLEGLENEKQVVKNEKRQGVDNRPYGHTEYVTLKALYPEGHPYSWDVIGSLDDLQNATLADVREFYQKWYGTNNATLVLAGDFDSEQAKAWIAKYFGDLEARGDVTPLPPMPVTLTQDKSLYHEDNFARLPELTISLPTVEQYHQDAYALDLLANILAVGKDSILYKTLVEQDKLAPDVQASNHSGEIAGVFSFTVRAFDGVDLDKVKASLDKALATFKANGFGDEQLQRIMTQRETNFYNGLTSVFNKAAAIARYNEFANDPHLITTEIERYRAVTKEDIMRVFNQYIDGKHSVATSFVPKGQIELALEGAIKADVVEEKIVQGAEQSMAEAAQTAANELKPLALPESSFDRSVMPADGKSKSVNLPDVWQSQLDNGVTVMGIEHNELPLVSFSIRMMGGHSLDPENKDGVANLLTSIMMEGTASKTPQQLEQRLGDLGADLNFVAEEEYITLYGNTLSKNFNEVISLAQEILLNPRWDEAEWQRIKKETQSQIQQSSANPGSIAESVFAKLIYGSDSKLGTPVIGSSESVSNINLDDVKRFYQQNIAANLTTVHVAGDITQRKVQASLNELAKGLTKKEVKLTQVTALPSIEKAQLYFVDVPNAKQSYIRIGNPAMAAGADDYYPAVAVNHQLGGSFSGQLFQILRLQKGYTYGAYSGINRRNGVGIFTAQSSVRSNVTLESLQTFREILGNYGKNFDQAALEGTQSVLKRANASAFETTTSLLGVVQNISSYQLPANYVEQQQQQLADLTLAQAKATINRYINPDKMIYLVVGDAKTQLPRLKELNMGEVIQLDRKGNKI